MTSSGIQNVNFNTVSPAKTMQKSEKSDIDFTNVLSKQTEINVNNTASFSTASNNDAASTANTEMKTDSSAATDSKADTNTVDESQDAYKYDSQKTRDDISDAKDVNETSISEDKMSEVTEAVEEFSEKVIETVKNALNVTDDEITTAMENLGLTALDLTDPANLAKLFTEIRGDQDSLSLLMDDSFSTAVKDISNLTNNLTDTLKMSKETITGLINENTEVSVDTTDLMQNTVTDENAKISVSDTSSETGLNIPEEMEMASPDEKIDLSLDNEFTVKDDPDLNSDLKTQVEQNANTEVASNQEEIPVNAEKNGLHTADENQVEVKTEQTGSETSDHTEVVTDGDLETVVKAETEDGDSLQNGNENDDTSQAMFQQTVNTNQNNTVQFTATSPVEAYTSVNTEEIIDQIVEQAKVTIDDQVKTMQMELNPEHLGKLFMEVSENKEGQVTAKIVAQNEAVKNALEGQLALLQDKLSSQNTKVTEIEVTVGTHEFEENLENNAASENERELAEDRQQSNQRQNININMNNLDDLQGLMTEEEQLVAKIMRDNGNTVNLRA